MVHGELLSTSGQCQDSDTIQTYRFTIARVNPPLWLVRCGVSGVVGNHWGHMPLESSSGHMPLESSSGHMPLVSSRCWFSVDQLPFLPCCCSLLVCCNTTGKAMWGSWRSSQVLHVSDGPLKLHSACASRCMLTCSEGMSLGCFTGS